MAYSHNRTTIEETRMKKIAINQHGVYLEFTEPFPPAIVLLAHENIQFHSKLAMFRWLNGMVPGWRKRLTYHENLI